MPAPATMSDHPADLIELFSSIQGEGLLVGLRQIFLRFYGCNLTCAYCDTERQVPPSCCAIEGTPGRRDFVPVSNPVALDRVLSHLAGWQSGWPGLHHSLGLTGGEPLLRLEILREWLPPLRKHLPIYLETNGVLSTALQVLINHIDYIGMDFKLPSTAGVGDFWERHAEFLSVAAAKKVFVKVVVGEDTEEWEIGKSCEIIAAIDQSIPLILQPVTGDDGQVAISPIKVLELQELAHLMLREVRVIPQTHKFMGQI